jgi:hypothetical protein
MHHTDTGGGAEQARFRRNPLEILYTHSGRVKCRETWPPFLAARTMNPSVSFPSDTLLPTVVEAVKPDIKPAAQIVRDIVRHCGDEAE